MTFRASLIEKLIAWVEKYLKTLVKLPLHKDKNPSYFVYLTKPSTKPKISYVVPLYGLSSNFGLYCWFTSNRLTFSIGAVMVFAMAPDAPPKTKLLRMFFTFVILVELYPWFIISINLFLYFKTFFVQQISLRTLRINLWNHQWIWIIYHQLSCRKSNI